LIESRQSVLFLVRDLGTESEGATVRSIALGLPPDHFRLAVAVLRHCDIADTSALLRAGIAVMSVPVRHVMDIGATRRLRRFAREFGPDVVHACGVHAARFARFLVSAADVEGNFPRLVVSGASTPCGGIGGWILGRRLRRSDRVIPTTRAEGDRYRRLGVPAERLTLIAPAVPFAEQTNLKPASGEFPLSPGGTRLIVADGRSERGHGPRDAIITFDMLRYEFKDLNLAVVQSGRETAALRTFAHSLAFDDCRVLFVPDATGRRTELECAEAVIVTRPSGGGVDALEAMAMGKPVVGWRAADVAEIVEDKATGLLVAPGDHAALAAALRSLLVNSAYARRLGEAGRARAQERYGRARMIEQFGRLYRELAPLPCAGPAA
jgi:glycosyltransferase involved in cell wall biosynthesis